MEVVDIPLNLLHPAPWNPNFMESEMLDRLGTSLDRFGLLQPFVVRRTGKGYEVLSGDKRLTLSRKAGCQTVPCVVVELQDPQAMILAQALNRIQGQDDLGLKAELLRRVMEVVPQAEILALLPETTESLEALASLGKQDLAEYLGEWERARAVRLHTLQVRLTQAQMEVVEEVLERFRPRTREKIGPSPNLRGTALYLLCQAFLEGTLDSR